MSGLQAPASLQAQGGVKEGAPKAVEGFRLGVQDACTQGGRAISTAGLRDRDRRDLIEAGLRLRVRDLPRATVADLLVPARTRVKKAGGRSASVNLGCIAS